MDARVTVYGAGSAHAGGAVGTHRRAVGSALILASRLLVVALALIAALTK